MKILVIKLRTIGDVLLTTPLISNIKKQLPDSVLDVALNKGTEGILDCNDNVDNVLVYDRETIRSKHAFSRIINEFLFIYKIRGRSYDVVIDLDKGDRGAVISKFSKAKIRIGSRGIRSKLLANAYTDILPKHKRRHTVEINLDPLNILKLPIENKRVLSCFGPNDEKTVKEHLVNIGKFIHIHPFSRVRNKEIDIVTWSKIIDFCETDLGIKVVITSSGDTREVDSVNKIISLCDSHPINLGGMLTLKQVSALSKASNMFIGVDTAVMHMAAAHNVPILTFFGPTTPDIWGPWDNSLEGLAFHQYGGVQKIGKNIVFSDVRDCLPCNNAGCANSHTSQCLTLLDLDKIKNCILELLNDKN